MGETKADKLGDNGQMRTVVMDRTTHAQGEEALRESERKYRFLFEESPGISLMIDRNGRLQDVSKFALDEFGYHKEEVIGRQISEFLQPATREAAAGELEKAFRGEGTPWGEVEIVAKNGSVHTVLFSPTRLVVQEEDALPSILVTGLDICERKRAEAALREARTAAELERARIESILKTIPAGVVIIEQPDGRITYANDRAIELYGADPRGLDLETHGTKRFRLLKPDGSPYPPAELPASRALLRGEELFGEELVIERADGTRVQIAASVAPLINPGNERIGAVGSFFDITDRKRVEQALRESEERFRTSTGHLPDCFGTYSALRDASGRITDFKIEYVNRAACELTRLAEYELLGKRLCDLLPAYRESGLFENYCQVVETGVPLTEEFILEDLYGTEVRRRVFDIRVAKLGDGVVALWHEITDRVQAEEELRRTSSYLENLITFANIPIIVWDPDFKITRFNHAFEVLTGHRAMDVLAAPLEILLPEQSREEAITHIRRTMGGERWETLEIPILRRDGTVRDVLWNSANIFGEDGTTVIATIAQGLDITDRKHAEEQLKASLREKETLLRELHHRVKNNIQLISSMLHLHAQYIRDPTAFTFYKELQNRISSMALIHAKLYQADDLARIDFRNYLLDLTNALIHSYGFTADNVRVTLSAPEVLLNINTAVPLGLIINELVSNCLKHAFTGDRAGNEIRIELQPEAERGYVLKVNDNGIGFPAELDFRQTKTLGLQLVSTLVEQLRGTVELDRAAGTTFIIHFSERK
jgi:PAS domain S-box-containing protein